MKLFALEGVNTCGKTRMGKAIARKLRSKGINAAYIHAFGKVSPSGKRFYSMGFFEKPVLQTKLLLEDLTFQIQTGFKKCQIGIIDRYLIGILLYQINKTHFLDEKQEILQLIRNKSKVLPKAETFILDISYETLCQRYHERYGKLPENKHVTYLRHLIGDFTNVHGTHLDNNQNFSSNLERIVEIICD